MKKKKKRLTKTVWKYMNALTKIARIYTSIISHVQIEPVYFFVFHTHGPCDEPEVDSLAEVLNQ